MIEFLITACLIVIVVLTAIAVNIAHYIIDYRQLSRDFEIQEIKMRELEEDLIK